MGRTVVISGASTGLGRASALHPRGLRFDVLAGVRREDDAPAGTTAVQLDVTGARAQALVERLPAAVRDRLLRLAFGI